MDNLEESVRISGFDLDSYSLACLGALNVFSKKNPDKVVCLLRGGFPPYRVVRALAREYLNKDPATFLVPTSDFLRNKKYLIYALAENAARLANKKGRGSLFTIDTAITGSSSRQFIKEFIEDFDRAIRREFLNKNSNLDYHFVRFWSDSEGRYSRTKLKPVHNTRVSYGQGSDNCLCSLNFFDYNFGLKSLICEDNPTLLGIDYPIELRASENNGVRGQKSEYISQVDKHASIIVDDTNCFQPRGEQTTSDLFVDLVVEKSRQNIKKLSYLNERENLTTLTYPPYLVDFCKTLPKK
ncbi:MAG: hypothetical protein Q8L29_02775 [archaeon]|nr:hypothetical protein [archaeon]